MATALSPRSERARAGVLCLVALALALGSPGRGAAAPAGSACQEPPAAAAFVAAYARGDEAAAEELASPLYRAEWARLGVSADQRAAMRAPTRVGGSSATGDLAFDFAGAVAAPGGFSHLLYGVQSLSGDPPARTVWRLDSDAEGRVVWAEMVWLFARDAGPAEPTFGPAAAPPLPPTLAALHPVLLAGVRSSLRPEGFYALGLDAPAEGAPACSPGPVLFVAVDEDGDLRPGAWDYGQPSIWPADEPPARRSIDPRPDLAPLRAAYLATLR